jgi:hypothetical protein
MFFFSFLFGRVGVGLNISSFNSWRVGLRVNLFLLLFFLFFKKIQGLGTSCPFILFFGGLVGGGSFTHA